MVPYVTIKSTGLHRHEHQNDVITELILTFINLISALFRFIKTNEGQ